MTYAPRFIEKTVSYLTGLSAVYLRNTPISELRIIAQASRSKSTKITGVETKLIDCFGEKIRVLR